MCVVFGCINELGASRSSPVASRPPHGPTMPSFSSNRDPDKQDESFSMVDRHTGARLYGPRIMQGLLEYKVNLRLVPFRVSYTTL